MASGYPAALDTFATNHTDGEAMATVHPAVHNDLGDAMNKVQAALGINPKGTFADVAARLAKPDPVPFSRAGVLSVLVGTGGFVFPFAATLVDVRARVNTAPVGASILVDVNKNGTTVFTTQGNRPSITAGQTQSAAKVPDSGQLAVAAGDVLTVDVDQVGSTTPGSDLTVVVTYKR